MIAGVAVIAGLTGCMGGEDGTTRLQRDTLEHYRGVKQLQRLERVIENHYSKPTEVAEAREKATELEAKLYQSGYEIMTEILKQKGAREMSYDNFTGSLIASINGKTFRIDQSNSGIGIVADVHNEVRLIVDDPGGRSIWIRGDSLVTNFSKALELALLDTDSFYDAMIKNETEFFSRIIYQLTGHGRKIPRKPMFYMGGYE